MGRIVAGIRNRLSFGSRSSDRAERRRQRRIRASMIHSHVNHVDPHGAAAGSQPVRGRGPERYQGRS
jgi:hypothetical protein